MGLTEFLLRKIDLRSYQTDDLLAEILGPVRIPTETSFDLIPPGIAKLVPDMDIFIPSLKTIIAHRLKSNLHQFPEYLKDRLDCVTAIVLSFCLHPYEPGINQEYTAIDYLTANAAELESIWKLDLRLKDKNTEEFEAHLENTIGAMMLLDMIMAGEYYKDREMLFLSKKIDPLLKAP